MPLAEDPVLGTPEPVAPVLGLVALGLVAGPVAAPVPGALDRGGIAPLVEPAPGPAPKPGLVPAPGEPGTVGVPACVPGGQSCEPTVGAWPGVAGAGDVIVGDPAEPVWAPAQHAVAAVRAAVAAITIDLCVFMTSR